MTWAAGQQLYGGRYLIERLLGEGGFGVTYLATDKKGKHVVIKTLKDEVLKSSQLESFRRKYLQDFLNEALRLALSRHPHIVQIENAFHEGELPCMVMEYIEGEDLWQRVNRQGVLSEAEALLYIQQIGDALTVTHEKGLLHRDVKPQNILVRQGCQEAVLIDFGMAREFIPDVELKHTQQVTHCFAPIEQYAKEAIRGEYTDIYALAATLYYLLTKQVPPPSPARAAGVMLKPPQQFNPDISDTVNQAILTGMAFSSDDRPESVPEWLAMLTPEYYRKLEHLLANRKWREADETTYGKMLEITGRQAEGWLRIQDIEAFPCEDLRTINQLWVRYSNGRFGFSVQKSIWESVGGKTGIDDYETEKNYAEKVGWRIDNEWVFYDNLTFTLNAPPGHLPTGVWGLLPPIWVGSIGFFSRVESCKI
ncbi:MAG TPA: serine/threonine protein kinase [Cyanobacteria bacterium UBA12227]|nr:serine/threonine protein kinase [Cyanobacteria bacterium UBA12227]HAX84713.1 serine/threonine protein kinase [Cyanobacteria bacterium UBA11370]